jgi:copper homeostasis protein
MIRPKEGGFAYAKNELEIMKADIKAAKIAGASGVVFGVLTANNKVADSNLELLMLAKSLGLQTTFHRAFDFIEDYKTAVKTIINWGFNRLLSSGLQPKAVQGLPVIAELQKHYGNQIEIMAGSGIHANNVLKIANSGIQNLHFTAQKVNNNTLQLAMGEDIIVDEEKIKSIMKLF